MEKRIKKYHKMMKKRGGFYKLPKIAQDAISAWNRVGNKRVTKRRKGGR